MMKTDKSDNEIKHHENEWIEVSDAFLEPVPVSEGGTIWYVWSRCEEDDEIPEDEDYDYSWNDV